MCRYLLLLILYVYSASSQDDGCPIDFTRNGDSCYHIFDNPLLSWWDAMAFCAIYGQHGTLATIESDAEQLYLEAQLKANFPSSGKDFWLGANDLNSQKTWIWVKKNEYVEEYTRWAPGQPSNSDEHCLALFDGVQYRWNDAPCHLPEGFICETPISDQVGSIVG